MVKRNPSITNITAGYLFPEIARRRQEYAASHPETATAKGRIISLGIGNTTEPLTTHIGAGMVKEALMLGTEAGYSGYGEDMGLMKLREEIAAILYQGKVKAEEVSISDGAKCDIGRLQLLFGPGVDVAVQDPSYPVYVDGSVLIGAAGGWEGSGYKGITYLPCTAENDYFPDLTRLPRNGIVYFCSPNNPTGAVATRKQLSSLVEAALQKDSIIIYDAAYAEFIRDPALPKSIYEIAEARQCAIEVSSFSKPAGFTGVRLGWTVVPLELRYHSGESINADWNRICTTVFNGASNIAQAGGLAALEQDGLREMRSLTNYYLGNAKLIRAALTHLDIDCVGGGNSPYIWARFPGRDSWEVFAEILEKCQVVTTPGVGFGPAGQSFIRFSAFGHRGDVKEACRRLERLKETH
ncbi:MAG: LL-diaminopimelate aminotransferase [Treponema sp.]|jgi:LL-diaminopimelate aminotransferase|nr:LL-diaminopimelate aminotransferase [Treponema sp.]